MGLNDAAYHAALDADCRDRTGQPLPEAVLREARDRNPALGRIKCPKTWYVTSDGILDFIRHNSLEDVYNQKYVDIDQVRQEYPHIVQLFKNSRFTSDILDGLSVVLDDPKAILQKYQGSIPGNQAIRINAHERRRRDAYVISTLAKGNVVT
jgi:hypothetical protein